MRIAFAGTPDFAVPSLLALINASYKVIAIYTQPDRPAGRGRHLHESPIKHQAAHYSIPIFQPGSLKNPEVLNEFKQLKPDLMVVVAYGMLLPHDWLNTPHLGCINVHASLLPRWRGAAPIQHAILKGDRQSGVSLMQMNRGLDTGPILAQTPYSLKPDETGGSLHDTLSILGAELLKKSLPDLLKGNVCPTRQNDNQATYAHKLTKEGAQLDWNRTAFELERQVRAFNPYPGAWTTLMGAPLRIFSAQALDSSLHTAPGTLVNLTHQSIDIMTGEGILRLTQVQPAGKRKMSAEAFINGHQATLILGETVLC